MIKPPADFGTDPISQAVKPLRWTSKEPSVPGWYWLRVGTFKKILSVVQITESSLNGNFGFKQGDWSGPIPEPQEGEI